MFALPRTWVRHIGTTLDGKPSPESFAVVADASIRKKNRFALTAGRSGKMLISTRGGLAAGLRREALRRLGATTGGAFSPGLFWNHTSGVFFFAEEKRAIPINVDYPKVERDDVTYLRPDYDVERATTNDQLQLKNQCP